MLLLVTLMLGLFLAGELCHGQRSSRRGRGMGRGRGRQFSCTDCREESMYDPYVCQNCYRGADGKEPFKCRRCKYVGSRSQPFVCQKCSKGPRFQNMFIKKQLPTLVFRWLQFLHKFFNFYYQSYHYCNGIILPHSSQGAGERMYVW